MSVPFYKKRKQAVDFWKGVDNFWDKLGKPVSTGKVVKVFVPKSRGFLQARESGLYYITKPYADALNLKIVKRKSR